MSHYSWMVISLCKPVGQKSEPVYTVPATVDRRKWVSLLQVEIKNNAFDLSTIFRLAEGLSKNSYPGCKSMPIPAFKFCYKKF